MTTYYYKNTVTGLVSQNSDYSTPQAVTKAAAGTGTGSEYLFQRLTVGTGSAIQAYRVGEFNTAMSSLKSAVITNVGTSGLVSITFFQPDRDLISATLSGSSPTQAGTFTYPTTSKVIFGYQVAVTGSPFSAAQADGTATHAVIRKNNTGYGVFHVVPGGITAAGIDLFIPQDASGFTGISGDITVQFLRKCKVVLDAGEQLVVPDLVSPVSTGDTGSEETSAIGIANVSPTASAEIEFLVVGA